MGTWVDLSKELPGGSSSPARTTPVPFGGESDYMRMLREAQSETSARTSARVSPITSAFVSQGNTRAPPSPKSPPNSPNLEFSDSEEINSHIYINRAPTPASEEMSAFLWDWSTSSSCPPFSATTPPAKNWALSLPRRPKKRQESSKGWGSRTFAGLLFSNLMSLLLGAGLGVWIYRRTTRTIEVVI